MSGGVHLPGGPDDTGDEDLPRLRRELATVGHEIAKLLIQPPYDSARLAELDQRADALRARIRALEDPARRARRERRVGTASGPSRR